MRRTPYMQKNQRLKPANEKRNSVEFKLNLSELGSENAKVQKEIALKKGPYYTDRKYNRLSPTNRRPVTGKNNYIQSNFPEALKYKDSKNYFEIKGSQLTDKQNIIQEKDIKNNQLDKNKRNNQSDFFASLKGQVKLKQKNYRASSFRQDELKQISMSFQRNQLTPTPNQRYQKQKKVSKGYLNGRSATKQEFQIKSSSTDPKRKLFEINESRKKIFDLLDKNSKLNDKKQKKKQEDQELFFQYVLRFSYRTKKGFMPNNPGKCNQDSYIISPNINKKSWQHYFGICDGHGIYGHHVSGFIKNTLPNAISSIKNIQKNPKENLHKAFQTTVKKLMTESHIDLTFSGSTVVGCFLQHNKLYCCNVGDSRSIIGYKKEKDQKWEAKELSIDHKPSLDRQAQRIKKNKGRVQAFKDQEGNPIGPLRVWLKDENVPGLAMTRSFGDLVAASVGVSWQPQILEFTLTENDKIILIASDGVWQFLENKQIIDLLAPFYQKNKIQEACDFLLELAHNTWTKQCSVIDDISFVLIFMSYNTD